MGIIATNTVVGRTLASFSINGTLYEVVYGIKTGDFKGYMNSAGEYYQIPDYQMTNSGPSNYNINYTKDIGGTRNPENNGPEIAFKANVNNMGGDISIIQVVTNEDSKIDVYKLRHTFVNKEINPSKIIKGLYVSTFVDAGRFSPSGDLGTGIYYGYEKANEKGYGYINFYDAPNVFLDFKKVSFETIIVAKDYHGSPYLLGSFRWGSGEGGVYGCGTVPKKLGPVSPNALKIIKNDYPSFKFKN